MRIAQLGYGYWGPNVLRAVSTHPDAEISVICDSDPKRLAQAGRLFPNAELSSDVAATVADNWQTSAWERVAKVTTDHF